MQLKNTRLKERILLFVTVVAVCYCFNTLISNHILVEAKENERQEIITAELDINSKELKSVADKYEHIPEIKGKEREALEKKINEITYANLDEVTRKEALGALGFVDVYKEDISYASASKNVNLNTPTVTYNKNLKGYSISATGGLNGQYVKDEFSWLFCPSVGDVKKLGGVDCVGFSITNVSGNTSNVRCIVGAANFLGKGVTGSSTLITENDINGVAYELQDKVTCTKSSNYIFYFNYLYAFNADSIKCNVAYTKELANCSGTVKLFYVHTWDKTKIDSVSVSNDGVSVDYTTSGDSWKAYSYGNGLP